MKFQYVAILSAICFIEVNSQLDMMNEEVLFKRAKKEAEELKNIFGRVIGEELQIFLKETMRIRDEFEIATRILFLNLKFQAGKSLQSVDEKAFSCWDNGVKYANVKECIEKMDNITNITTTERFRLGCPDEELLKASYAHGEIIYRYMEDSVPNYHDDPTSCKRRKNPIECLAAIIGVITTQKTDLLASEKTNIQNKLQEVKLHVEKAVICYQANVDNFETYMGNVFAEANSCLEEKMKIG